MKQRNYMGVLVVNHYTADEAIDCVGAQLPSPSITEIALYRASKDINTGKVIRGDMISKIHMSDHQFGHMIARPNFNSGQLVTIDNVSGYKVSKLENEFDPTKQDLSAEVNSLLGNDDDNQVARFINEMLALSESAVEKNRLIKRDKEEIQKYGRMLLTYVQSNENYALNVINKVAEKRSNEVKSSIHHTIRDAHRIGGEALLSIENKADSDNAPRLSSAGFMMVSLGNSTSEPLFDDVNMSHSVVGITLATAVAKKSIFSTREDMFSKEEELFKVIMSPEQYARFVRADKMEVSCTISRLFAEKMDEFDRNDTREVQYSPSEGSDLFSEYIHAVKQVINGLEEDKYKGKAGLRSLLDGFKLVKERYEAYLQDSTDAKLSATQAVFEDHQKRLSEFFENEVALLPDSVKGKIVSPLSGLVSKAQLQLAMKKGEDGGNIKD